MPQGLPSLKALVEEVRAPGAARAEVDALLAGLAQPLSPEQSPRERADLLLSLIEDAHLSSFVGSGGRTVRNAAVQALLALGYPYALEVPPDALAAQLSEEPSDRRNLLSSTRARTGFGIIVAVAVLLLLPVLYASLFWAKTAEVLLIGLILIGTATLIPAYITVVGHNSRNTVLKGFGIAWLILSSMLFGAPNLYEIVNGISMSLIPPAIGGLILLGTGLMTIPSKS